VADTLGMMGLGVARSVIAQQRDAAWRGRGAPADRREPAAGYRRCACCTSMPRWTTRSPIWAPAASGEDDPSAVENRRTVDVLAHEAIANFAAAREHFVAFIETSWNHAELQDVPRLLGDVSGALRMLDLPPPPITCAACSSTSRPS
jgi:chemosensory pili system protein ChpA (sensor histidine kinase/response regulator)